MSQLAAVFIPNRCLGCGEAPGIKRQPLGRGDMAQEAHAVLLADSPP